MASLVGSVSVVYARPGGRLAGQCQMWQPWLPTVYVPLIYAAGGFPASSTLIKCHSRQFVAPAAVRRAVRLCALLLLAVQAGPFFRGLGLLLRFEWCVSYIADVEPVPCGLRLVCFSQSDVALTFKRPVTVRFCMMKFVVACCHIGAPVVSSPGVCPGRAYPACAVMACAARGPFNVLQSMQHLVVWNAAACVAGSMQLRCVSGMCVLC
jgi:hypothetical protein